MTAMAMTGITAKILVVDDEAHGRFALQHLLDGPDREVILASSGEEALRHVAANEFALVLLDVRMPGMDGFETAAFIRKDVGCERTPIIFLTGAYEDMASVIRGYAAGAVDYVVKPVEPEVLKSKVAVFVDLYHKNAELARQILEREKAERALSRANEDLESRIRERTDSLVVANDLLHKEIAMRRQVEDELRHAKQAAEAANVAKTEFLANMSHEIRTPMNAIVGMTELALQAELSPEVRDYLTLVKASSDSLLTIINDILDLSKIEAGRLAVETIPFSLRECIGDAMKTLAVQAHEKRLELACDIATSVPDALVGDPLRLRQIAINLVGNGIKFTDHGEVVLRVELDSRTDNRASFHFSVSDSGVGIPKNRQRTIFTRFLQAETSTTRLYGGTGLGLTIAARLVEMMQGKIWVESEPEKGSVFHFIARFDLQPGESAVLPAAKLDGLRVLVVEDHPVSRGILAKLLKEWHAEVQEAESADVALRLTKQSRQTGQPFQLILLDDTLPGIDSHVLAAQIRHAQSGTPAVMMLGFATHKDDGSSRVGADLIGLTKPVKHSELRDAVISALGLSTPARRRSAPQVPVPPAEKLKILLVEDNLFSQKLARYVLQKHGHEVVVADDGVAAVEVYSRRRFDLILMDVRMPRMDGLQTTAAIRDREKHTGGHIPIIALTANAMVGDRESCLRAGMDECLIKPVRPAALIAVVDRLRQRPPCATGSADTGKPVLDHAALLERVDGDIALLDEMVGAFRRDCGRLMSGAHDAIARRDAGALAYALHTLCGMFRNLSADAAQEAVSETQKLDLENDLEGVRLRFSALENEVRLLNSRLANPHSWRAATYGQDWRGGDGKQAG